MTTIMAYKSYNTQLNPIRINNFTKKFIFEQ